jgi:hydrogenase expression/formation protein HypE
MNNDRILFSHGSGGKLSHELVGKIFLPFLADPMLSKLDDSAIFEASGSAGLHHRRLCSESHIFPGRRYRQAGRLPHGERPEGQSWRQNTK